MNFDLPQLFDTFFYSLSDTASVDLKHASWQGNIEAVKDILVSADYLR